MIADDWINVDPNPILAPVVDDRDTNDFADGCLDGIVANHSLQCLRGHELGPAVRELRRVVRPGGRLRVLVPDVVEAFRAYTEREYEWPGFAAISEQWNLERKFAHYLTWGGQNRSCFTERSLAELLERNQFRVPADWTESGWEWLRALDSRLGESLIVEAVACG